MKITLPQLIIITQEVFSTKINFDIPRQKKKKKIRGKKYKNWPDDHIEMNEDYY